MDINKNLSEIRNNISKNVDLVVAAKYASLNKIKELINLGEKSFGFNTLENLKQFLENLPELKKCNIHFIGNIQSNKIKKILLLKPYLIHSIDSVEKAKKLNNFCEDLNFIQDVLLQIKTDEKKDSGFNLKNFDQEFYQIKNLKNIKVRGLMTFPPRVEEIGEKNIEEIYKKISNLQNKLKLEIFSAGTSDDYQLAIKSGSNMIRIGRKLFS